MDIFAIVKLQAIILFLFFNVTAFSQSDTTVKQGLPASHDSTTVQQDSIFRDSLHKDSVVVIAPAPVARKLTWRDDSLFQKIFKGQLFNKPAVYLLEKEKQFQSKDYLFYAFASLLIFIGFLRLIFPRYFQSIFRLFSQSSFRQRQTREQLSQDFLPSLLFNLLFIVAGGLFIALLSVEKNWMEEDFWKLAGKAVIILASIYLTKYLFLLFAGWVFHVREVAGIYSFIVFFINKIVGIALIPCLLLMAFSTPALSGVAATVAVAIVVLMFIYRYIVSFSSLRYDLHVNALHFFIYLCAVEIAPLLVIYKLFRDQLGGSI
ncbi:MAG: hypothetical protein JWN76_547 [Chitinophagaceae bacterium]|nr:hypothetical protein [Chitinophagaceae bacterium]